MPASSPHDKLRISIGQRVRRLRQDRGWTQTQLAEALGLSQNRLSEIEHGKGSFTAEQLLAILKVFNVSLDSVAPHDAGTASELQNALARLGAVHLAESPDVLPTERLKAALGVIRETLASAETPRQIAALAPVIVNHAENLSLARLRLELKEVGLDHRLGWVLDNTLDAIRVELEGDISGEWDRKYRRALCLLSDFLAESGGKGWKPRGGVREDVLDRGIASGKTLEEVRAASSKASRKWGIVSRIQAADFAEALRASRGGH